MECKINIFLLEDLFQHLQNIGRCTLIFVQNPIDTTLRNQGWLKAHEIGSGEDLTKEGPYKSIRLNNDQDELSKSRD